MHDYTDPYQNKNPWWAPLAFIGMILIFVTVVLPMFLWILSWIAYYITQHGLPIWNLLPWPK